MLRSFVRLAGAMILLSVATVEAQVVVPETPGSSSILSLQSKAAANGGLPVIVELAGSFPVPVAEASPASDSSLTALLLEAQTEVASTVLGADRPVKHMSYQPMFAATVTADEIARLAADPRVARVVEDRLDRPTLTDTLGLIKMTGAGGAYARGAGGRGRAVAVLDTGVDRTHEFLRNKVIAEACYSTTNGSQGATSLCVRSGPGKNQGLDCPPSVRGCGHGTHVAGIAAGRNSSLSTREPVNGVARNGSIVAVQVFSRFTGPMCGSGDCVLSFQSDQIMALEYIYSLRKGVGVRRIDAVNMSLGGGSGLNGYCNSDSRAPIITLLREAGIATVIAAGNAGFFGAVAEPGCIEAAITVGATTKARGSKKMRISYYSNMGFQVDVLAPGGDPYYPFGSGSNGTVRGGILSSYHKKYAGLSGTSMATPHVAGAIAAMRSRKTCQDKTVSQFEEAFGTTGPEITDHRPTPDQGPITKHLLDVPAVMKALGC